MFPDDSMYHKCCILTQAELLTQTHHDFASFPIIASPIFKIFAFCCVSCVSLFALAFSLRPVLVFAFASVWCTVHSASLHRWWISISIIVVTSHFLLGFHGTSDQVRDLNPHMCNVYWFSSTFTQRRRQTSHQRCNVDVSGNQCWMCCSRSKSSTSNSHRPKFGHRHTHDAQTQDTVKSARTIWSIF